MIVLDTDHLSVLKYHDSPLSRRANRNVAQSLPGKLSVA